MTEVIMPKMGDGMEEGTLLEWLKNEGDAVKSGEVIGNIQTDKATLELEAPGSGKLAGILIKPGETVPVGKPIAALLKEGEALPDGWGGGGASAPKTEEAKKEEAKSEEPAKAKEGEAKTEDKPAEDAPKAEAKSDAPASDERVKASPLARKIAAEKGLDLSKVTGTGPGGRIVEKDLANATSAPKTATVASTATAQPVPNDEAVSLNKIRQITAKKTTESKQQVPHFYVTVEVDCEKLLAIKDLFEEEGAGKVTVNDFVIKACAAALRDMPGVNSEFKDGALLQHGAVNIGMAVALEDGLTLPVIQNADQLSIKQIGSAARDLAKKARENKLGIAELSGGTFSISNMGMLNVEVFQAIIVQPNAGILAVGTAKKKVVVNEEGEIEVRSKMNITGSYDHRVVDGAVGAKFTNVIREYLENPTRLLG